MESIGLVEWILTPLLLDPVDGGTLVPDTSL